MNVPVIILYNLPAPADSPWHEADAGVLNEVAAVAAALRAEGLPFREAGVRRLADIPAALAPDPGAVVFNLVERLDGALTDFNYVPAVCAALGHPCTGNTSDCLSLTLDKSLAKRVVADAGLRTPAFAVIRQERQAARVRLPYPLFAKPLAEGTGKGVTPRSRADTPRQLKAVCRELLQRFAQPVLVEEFLPGREFTTGVLGNGDEARPLGTLEIVIPDPAHRGIYSFETKEKCEHMVQYPALARGRLRDRIEKLALAAYLALECQDAARVDIRLDPEGRPSFMEINPLPGLHPTHSDLPMIATAEGLSYRDLIGSIIHSAAARAGCRAA